MNGFCTTAGSVTGTEHQRTGRNNQDAWRVLHTPTCIIAIVADGCGTCLHSEFGARLGVTIMAAEIARLLPGIDLPESGLPSQEDVQRHLLEPAREALLREIGRLAEAGGESLRSAVRERFLFTLVGVVLTPAWTATFAIGDGLIALNGEIQHLGPFLGNCPPYCAYALVSTDPPQQAPLCFRIVHLLPTDEVSTIALGTDGVLDLLAAAENPLPGREEKLGGIDQFWTSPVFAQNPDAMRRRLFLANQPQIRANWTTQRLERFQGLLPDDTTLLVVRRLRSSIAENAPETILNPATEGM